MICLFIETTSLQGSVALYSFHSTQKIMRLLALEEWTSHKHSAFITSAFENLLKVSGVSIKDISVVGLGVGPGRFTGVRMAVSFAKTLGFATRVSLYAFSSLKILVASAILKYSLGNGYILALVNAFKNSVYTACYQKKQLMLKTVLEPQVVCLSPLDKKLLIQQPCVCVGDGYEAYSDLWPVDIRKKWLVKSSIFPHVRGCAELFKSEFEDLKKSSWTHLQPVYLRNPVSILTIDKKAGNK